MATKTIITASEFLAYPSDARCELVCGEVIEMSPPGFAHGIVCLTVGMLLRQWARLGAASHGFVAVNDPGVVTQHDPDTVRAPDCVFVREDRIPAEFDRTGFLTIVPDLAVEVMSPNDRRSELIAKSREYLDAGVQEVWLVDFERRQVEVFRSEGPPLIFKSDDEIASNKVLPGFSCRVSDFFADL